MEMGPPDQELTTLYHVRFPNINHIERKKVWKVIVSFIEREMFPGMGPLGRVLDLGAGYCEFINQVSPTFERVAIDLSDRILQSAGPGVQTHVGSFETWIQDAKRSDYFDVIFLSNFLEHLQSADEIQKILRLCKQALRVGGRLIILGPNYRYVGADYWNEADHILPLNAETVVEHGGWAGLRPAKVIPRILPYTFKSKLPKPPFLVDLYLKMPLAWRFFGKQFLIAFEK